MTSGGSFCPRCGRETSPALAEARPAGDRGLCRACYLEEHHLVDLPQEIAIEQCTGCHSVRIDDTWTDAPEDRIEVAIDAVADRVQVHIGAEDVAWEVVPDPINDDTIDIACHFHVDIEGETEHISETVTVIFEPTSCTRCSRIAGQDYAAIVQLRADTRMPAADEIERAREITATLIEERVDIGDRDSFLTDVKERSEGIDFWLSTTKLGHQLAKRLQAALGGTLSTSRTLVTTDADGQEVYRVTHAVRLPRYRPGDVVATDDGVALVESANETVELRDLGGGSMRSVASDDLDAERVATVEEATDATIVAALDERAVQVLDPATQEAVTIARYDDVDVSGDVAPVVRVDGQLYLLPDDVA